MTKESVSFRDYIRKSEWIWEDQIGGQKKSVGIKCFVCNTFIKDPDIAIHFEECIISKPRGGRCAEELAEAKATIRNLSSAHLRARTEISDLKKKVAEIQEARTLRFKLPESWAWSDCFFCSEPIKDNTNYDTFMSKPIHKECREKLIDGLNASYREKEKEENAEAKQE